MTKHTLEIVVAIVSVEIKKSNLLCHVGKLQGTRKKPHAIDVALEQNIQHSFWFIT
jgi:hypothetical protein